MIFRNPKDLKIYSYSQKSLFICLYVFDSAESIYVAADVDVSYVLIYFTLKYYCKYPSCTLMNLSFHWMTDFVLPLALSQYILGSPIFTYICL